MIATWHMARFRPQGLVQVLLAQGKPDGAIVKSERRWIQVCQPVTPTSSRGSPEKLVRTWPVG
jgi:hypothetical protein